MLNRKPLAILTALAALCLPAYADRASDAYKHGVDAERHQNYDSAYTFYKQANALTPNNAKYLSAYMRLRFNAAAQHTHSGQLLRNTGALTQALAEFQRAVEIDASSFLAQQEVRVTADMIRRKERQQSAPKAEAPPVKVADLLADLVELQPLSTAPITLHLTVNADAAYKTICKLAGINVIIDPDYRPQKITVDLTDVTLREALDMVRLQSKTFWRPVLRNTILVATESASKRKEVEQNVMRTFYLQNISTPADLQEAANVVRQMLDVTRVQLLAAQDALIVRGTPDQMVLAEKLLADLDKPKSEVVIDIAVMQVSRDRIRTMGMNVPTSVSVGVLPSISGNSNGTSGGGFTFGNFSFGVSGGSFTFLASDSNTKLLQNPEIRALNDQKATLRIGDRVPIATGSFQPGMVGGGGVSPLVSTQFQYLDVGVNIDITPHIHSDREVTLKMTLEISSVTGSESIGGITQPIIGQRRIDHETRLLDGEVNLLGGILEDSETQSMSGYPWVSKLPILKYLFAQDNKQRTENEIIFAITPHIIRALDVTEDNRRTIEVGTGTSTELRRKPLTPATPAPGQPADPAKPQQPAQPAPPAAAATPGALRSSVSSPAGAQAKSGARQ
jgi:general secretion pathway protein D